MSNPTKDLREHAAAQFRDEVSRAAGPSASGPVIVRLSDVQPERVEWLWPGRVAIGKLTLIAGDPGLGKSLLTIAMAARVSTGSCWPDVREETQPVGGVVFLSAEDDVADTIRPRLDAAGADVSRVIALDGVRHYDAESGETSERSVCLATDLRHLEAALDECPNCRLVVVDPITAYLGRTDDHRNSELRGVLKPLADLAAGHRVAMVCLTHLNKGGTGSKAVYRSMGSLAYTAAARAVFAVSKDRDDPSRRLLLPVKANLAPDSSGLAFTVVPAGLGSTPVLRWERDPVTLTADEALAPDFPTASDGDGGAIEEAEAWLAARLAHGPVASATIIKDAERDGIAKGTLRRAKERLGVEAKREGFGSEGAWSWRLAHRCATEPKDAHPVGMSTYREPAHLCDRTGDSDG